MCISASASINAFIINLISAICLMYFGNENLKTINYIVGTFSVFTSFMQLVDLGMWLDLDCKNGLNKIASLAGPILNYLQPFSIFLIAYLWLNYSSHGLKKRADDIVPLEKESNLFNMLSISSNKINLGKIINFIALAIILFLLIRYYTLNEDVSCTTPSGQHIKWGWLSKLKVDAIIFSVIYALIAIPNFYLIDPLSNYIKVIICGYIVLYFVSSFINSKYRGELWCMISNILPLIFLILQKVFKTQLSR